MWFFPGRNDFLTKQPSVEVRPKASHRVPQRVATFRIRRRIRACYWKQWRNVRARIANLRQLGVKKDEAVTHGCSRKGPWTLSSSKAVHEALSLDDLDHEG
ncbi:MAG: hypothetical protein R3C49_06895 [Planctomycetaceae bacterium]